MGLGCGGYAGLYWSLKGQLPWNTLAEPFAVPLIGVIIIYAVDGIALLVQLLTVRYLDNL